MLRTIKKQQTYQSKHSIEIKQFHKEKFLFMKYIAFLFFANRET